MRDTIVRDMIRRYERLVYIIPVASVIILLSLFQVTDPESVGPGGILAAFILLYIFFASCLFIMLHFGIGVVSRALQRNGAIEQRQWRVGVRKSYYIASILAFVPVCFLAMRSIDQLQLGDVILVIIFATIAIFYVVKRS